MEAEEVADRIGILNMGKLEQVGKPEEVFFYPKNEIVSDFIGSPNILNCDSYRTIGHGLAEVTCGGMSIILPHDGGKVQKISLFPRDIYISDVHPPGPQVNRFKGTISSINSSGTTVRIEVKVNGNILQTEMPHDIFDDMDLRVGKEAFLILKLRRIRTFEGKNSP
jgi:ABC-type Fe3+/spermidine/putrescine transport system ATPase subunit